MGTGGDEGYVIPPRYWRWVGTRETVVMLLWAVALGVGAQRLRHAFTWAADRSDTPELLRRADGNSAHTHIDFGGQWTMGRMLVLGRGRELYHRQRQWEVVRAGFPTADEAPAVREEGLVPGHRRVIAPRNQDLRHDADRMMDWFMGADPPGWKTAGGSVAAALAADPFGNPLAAVARQQAATAALTPELIAGLDRPAIGRNVFIGLNALDLHRKFHFDLVARFPITGDDCIPAFNLRSQGFAVDGE